MEASHVAMFVSGLLLLIFLILVLKNWWTGSDTKTSDYHTMMLVLVASIAFGLHGLVNAFSEVVYESPQ